MDDPKCVDFLLITKNATLLSTRYTKSIGHYASHIHVCLISLFHPIQFYHIYSEKRHYTTEKQFHRAYYFCLCSTVHSFGQNFEAKLRYLHRSSVRFFLLACLLTCLLVCYYFLLPETHRFIPVLCISDSDKVFGRLI